MSSQLLQIHPVLPVKNVLAALFFYVDKLGFDIAFADDPKSPKYAGVRRGNIEIHLQWHDESEWDTKVERPMLRILTSNVSELYQELSTKDIFHSETKVQNTAWGTQEFAFYDLYKNGLTFYNTTKA
ncbi:MAG: bleomycin resistance protein [Bacteroidetes bacterium MedPE-SWsnd-G2]|nr:MAG: bleomycin resistance protein [Bacteroidetes bacterium MedPE-SWsnd-G2]